VHVPDRIGEISDVILGFDGPQKYAEPGPFFGGIIGRYANRIAAGKFCIHELCYQLDKNEGENSLHGGFEGFDKRLWSAKVLNDEDGNFLQLTLHSVHGDQGFPGNLSVTAEYRFRKDNRLSIDYFAETDEDTIINLTQHPYFNLDGHGRGDILNHQLFIKADNYLPVNEIFIPTGDLLAVDKVMDFRNPKSIRDHIFAEHAQLKIAKGYDHTWILSGPDNCGLPIAATLYSKASGRKLSIFTDQPGIQFYSGNHLSITSGGKSGVRYNRYSGVALETQHFPDSPNNKHFPSTILYSGESYSSRTEWVFSVE
jgi:aldose 1-epimerase